MHGSPSRDGERGSGRRAEAREGVYGVGSERDIETGSGRATGRPKDKATTEGRCVRVRKATASAVSGVPYDARTQVFVAAAAPRPIKRAAACGGRGGQRPAR
eukprot:1725215-Pleurochrysis_carterae.AAC.3